MRSNDSLKVIVVGIPKSVDDSALSEMFSGYGSVADAKVVLDVHTQKSKGFGFVTFTAASSMKKAIQEMNKKVVDGRTLNVRELVPKDKFKPNQDGSKNPKARPCYLLKKGKCTKGDQCPYSHATEDTEFGSCFEFVQKGSCKFGDNCRFSHVKPSADQATSVEPSADKKKKTPKAATGTTQPGQDPEKRSVCFAFQKGRCHRGKSCRYLHEKVPELAQAKPVKTKKSANKPVGEFEIVAKEDDEPTLAGGKKRKRPEDEDVESEDEAETQESEEAEEEEEEAEADMDEETEEPEAEQNEEDDDEVMPQTGDDDEDESEPEQPPQEESDQDGPLSSLASHVQQFMASQKTSDSKPAQTNDQTKAKPQQKQQRGVAAPKAKKPRVDNKANNMSKQKKSEHVDMGAAFDDGKKDGVSRAETQKKRREQRKLKKQALARLKTEEADN